MKRVNIFETLKNRNQFPILFIGSGISKRYLENFPSWIQLLNSLWQDLNKSQNFYGRYKIIESNIKRESPEIDEKTLEFKTNLSIAQEIAIEFNNAVYEEKIQVKKYTPQYFFESGKNPFKEKIVEKLEKYKLIDSMREEVSTFQKALLKSQVVFTTNYDTFIEDLYNEISSYQIKKYIGQSGFFKNSQGYSEIYKIHGCVEDSESIVILEEDYKNYDENSILISATIISLMINSPIIFLGYSLSDLNVRRYLADFARAANKEGQDLSDKLIVVEFKENETELIEEKVFDPELNCKFTYIKTDNYTAIYNYIREIDQGIAPSEIRKYQSLIKQIIVDVGQQGQLKSVLVSPNELSKIEKLLDEKGIIENNIVVAFGDAQTIYKIPSLLDYLQQYYEAGLVMPIDVALNYIANAQMRSRLPLMKYLTEENISSSHLTESLKEKLTQRLNNHCDVEQHLNSIPSYGKKEYSTIEEILDSENRKYVKYALIAHNINKFELPEVERLIIAELDVLIEAGENEVNTDLRRLMLIHDLLTFGE